MKFITIFLLTFLLTISALAQNGASVSGLVMMNDKPVANATVNLTAPKGKTITVQTDADGKYSFSNLTPGVYKISALNGNFATSREITLAQNQALTTDLDLVLGARRSVPYTIKETVTISAGTSQTVEEISKSVSVLSGEEIKNRNEFALNDALRTVPGFRVQQLGGFGKVSNIKTRGLRNQDTAVLLDGQRIRDASAITGDVGSFLSDLTATNVQKIEILRGSGSSLYGTNAIGGVLNIQTAAPTNEFRGSLLAEGGGLGLVRGRAVFSDTISKFGYSAGVSHQNFKDGIDGQDAARNTTIQPRFDINLTAKTVISGRFYFSDAFVQLNSNPDTIGNLPASGIIEARPLALSELRRYAGGTPISQLNVGNATFIPDINDGDNSQSSRLFSGQIGLTQILTNNAYLRVSYQNLNTNRINRNGANGVGFQTANRSDFDGNIQTFNSKIDWTIKRFNILTVGYEFEREKFGNDNFNGTSAFSNGTDATQTANTIYLQNQLKFFQNRLQISGAFRAQWFSLGTPKFSGANPIYQNLTLRNPPTSYTADGSFAYFFRRTNTKIRAHVGNGYRIPSLYERFGSFFSSFGTPGFVALGDPELEPERSVAFDAGIDQNLYKNRLKLSATYFYTRLTDTIGFANTARAIGSTPRPFGGYANTKGGIARGGEFSADITPFNNTKLFFSYTYVNSDQRAPQVTGSRVLSTLGIPNHQFSFVATQQIAKNLTINFDFAATSSYLAPIFSNQTFQTRIYRFNGQRKGDLTISYQIPSNGDVRWRIFGTVENVFNQAYFENGFRTAKAWARGGVALSF